eukprot:m.121120 g.121120  ORF g.121120 m.121120 type:complete len:340 (+) comp28844_c0_seq18:2040-3059(+)
MTAESTAESTTSSEEIAAYISTQAVTMPAPSPRPRSPAVRARPPVKNAPVPPENGPPTAAKRPVVPRRMASRKRPRIAPSRRKETLVVDVPLFEESAMAKTPDIARVIDTPEMEMVSQTPPLRLETAAIDTTDVTVSFAPDNFHLRGTSMLLDASEIDAYIADSQQKLQKLEIDTSSSNVLPSNTSTPGRRLAPRPATALSDYDASSDAELSFSSGDTILVTDREDNQMWVGHKPFGPVGRFPSDVVALTERVVKMEKCDLSKLASPGANTKIMMNPGSSVSAKPTINLDNTYENIMELCMATNGFQETRQLSSARTVISGMLSDTYNFANVHSTSTRR